MSSFLGPRHTTTYVLSMACLLAAFGVQWIPWDKAGGDAFLPVVLSLALGVAFAVLLWRSETNLPRGRRLINLGMAFVILAILCFDALGTLSNDLQGVMVIGGMALLGVGGYFVWRSRPIAAQE